MLMPKRVKYRKQFRDRSSLEGVASRGSKIAFGEFGLKTLESIWLTSRQIEAARRSITHYTKRGGRVWIRVFPDKPVSKKPLETRMGSGKSAVDHYVAVVLAGRVVFEMSGVSKEVAQEALRRASHKLPAKMRFVER